MLKILSVCPVLPYSDDDMQMVRHDAEFPDLYHRIEGRYLLYLAVQDSLTQRGQYYPWLVFAARGRKAVALQRTEQGASSLHDKGQHIRSLIAIIMTREAPLHVVLYLFDLQPGFLGFFTTSRHTAKVLPFIESTNFFKKKSSN